MMLFWLNWHETTDLRWLKRANCFWFHWFDLLTNKWVSNDRSPLCSMIEHIKKFLLFKWLNSVRNAQIRVCTKRSDVIVVVVHRTLPYNWDKCRALSKTKISVFRIFSRIFSLKTKMTKWYEKFWKKKIFWRAKTTNNKTMEEVNILFLIFSFTNLRREFVQRVYFNFFLFFFTSLFFCSFYFYF